MYGQLQMSTCSHEMFERILAKIAPEYFNWNSKKNKVKMDKRSSDKGCEPENVTVGEVGYKRYAFVGLERTSGIAVVDVTDIEQGNLVKVRSPEEYRGPKVVDYYLDPLDRGPEDELKDNALESLTAMGESVVQPILQQIGKACDAGREALLDVLCHFPGNEQTFRIAMESFRAHPEKQALFAGYLAKLGDDRALEDLTEAANAPGLPYLTFIELRNAIESLGGTCPNREYDDDPEYEALRDLDRI